MNAGYQIIHQPEFDSGLETAFGSTQLGDQIIESITWTLSRDPTCKNQALQLTKSVWAIGVPAGSYIGKRVVVYYAFDQESVFLLRITAT